MRKSLAVISILFLSGLSSIKVCADTTGTEASVPGTPQRGAVIQHAENVGTVLQEGYQQGEVAQEAEKQKDKCKQCKKKKGLTVNIEIRQAASNKKKKPIKYVRQEFSKSISDTEFQIFRRLVMANPGDRDGILQQIKQQIGCGPQMMEFISKATQELRQIYDYDRNKQVLNAEGVASYDEIFFDSETEV